MGEMLVLDQPADIRRWSISRRGAGGRVAFVPTMGALHDGHLRLIDVARTHGDAIAVSIFVNPLQFNRRDDYDAYPRPTDDDLQRCVDARVDAVYAPTVGAMYPSQFQTHVEPGALAEPLEGSGRPGHFRGVATVVAKLFNAVRPDVAVFGEKDFQQLAIIRRMVIDLDMGIDIVGMPTVREADGLAMSSRNTNLGPQARQDALAISRYLQAVRGRFAAGERSASALLADPAQALAPGRVDYASLVDADDLQPVETVTRPALVAVAAYFLSDPPGLTVRLIDNCVLRP